MSIFVKPQKPLLGTNSFPTNESPRYVKGMAISAAFTFFTGVLAFGLRCLLVWENHKLDKVHGSNKNRAINQPGGEGQESGVGEENYGPTFRVRTFRKRSFLFATKLNRKTCFGRKLRLSTPETCLAPQSFGNS